MELLITILMYLGVYATPDMLNNEEFNRANEQAIAKAKDMAQSGNYQERDGIVIGSGTYPLK